MCVDMLILKHNTKDSWKGWMWNPKIENIFSYHYLCSNNWRYYLLCNLRTRLCRTKRVSLIYLNNFIVSRFGLLSLSNLHFNFLSCSNISDDNKNVFVPSTKCRSRFKTCTSCGEFILFFLRVRISISRSLSLSLWL